jgi:hypothetical protein
LLVAAAASSGFSFSSGADASAVSAFGASAWAADDPSAAVVGFKDATGEAVGGFCTEAEAGASPAEAATAAVAATLAFRFLNLEILAEPGLEALAWDGLATPPAEAALAFALGVLLGDFTMPVRRGGSRRCAGRAAAHPRVVKVGGIQLMAG